MTPNSFMKRPKRTGKRKPAFTLIEVILALAILGGSLAVLGEIMSLSDRQGSKAHAETRAQLLAESVMDQLVSGAIELIDKQDEPFEASEFESSADVRWTYSVVIGEGDVPEVQIVEVTVQQDLEAKFDPAKQRLIRWILPPSAASESSAADPMSPEAATSGTGLLGGGQL
ncbi:type IV pilus modification PilV family protein [Adhaeretor mobilis]|uniref:Type II secretion system protein n=1 Tax=Adhaeretor mobilis TaxID=1930276 RepID=A0A517MUM6_9BACT|nr:type II secretion system protein [Adhaeretor mobilis]QDS98593.1 hypothetical protein HG15A2_18740 [Adhaeretor mobilis]